MPIFWANSPVHLYVIALDSLSEKGLLYMYLRNDFHEDSLKLFNDTICIIVRSDYFADYYFRCKFLFKDKKKKYEPPIPTRVGKKQKKTKGPDAANKLPQGIKGHLHVDSCEAAH